MKQTILSATRANAAFTSIELVLVVFTLVMFALVVLPTLLRPKSIGCGALRCPSNLKQIGLAFRMWANDHEGKFPMQLTVAEGGAREFTEQGLPLMSFVTISNELNSPKLLACPQDSSRTRARTFDELTVTNLTYFISLDASEANYSLILAGDRNISISGTWPTGLVELTNPNLVAWDMRIHTNKGCLVWSDGSAHMVDSRVLQNALRKTGVANRFAVP